VAHLEEKRRDKIITRRKVKEASITAFNYLGGCVVKVSSSVSSMGKAPVLRGKRRETSGLKKVVRVDRRAFSGHFDGISSWKGEKKRKLRRVGRHFDGVSW